MRCLQEVNFGHEWSGLGWIPSEAVRACGVEDQTLDLLPSSSSIKVLPADAELSFPRVHPQQPTPLDSLLLTSPSCPPVGRQESHSILGEIPSRNLCLDPDSQKPLHGAGSVSYPHIPFPCRALGSPHNDFARSLIPRILSGCPRPRPCHLPASCLSCCCQSKDGLS